MSELRIVVVGLPAPQGSKRFVGTHGGRGILVESSKHVKPWREAVLWAAREARHERIDGPVAVTITFTLPKPQSAPKRRVTYPDRKPDVDKTVRSTLDAIVSAGLIEDDARVVELTAAKRYPNEGHDALDVPGAVIEIRRIA